MTRPSLMATPALDETPRLLLLEFFRGALRRDERGMLFPFLQGLTRERGGRTLWLAYGGDLEHRAGAAPGRSLHAALPPADRLALARRLERFRPTRVLTNAPLSEDDAALFAARGVPVRLMPQAGELEDRGAYAECGWFLDWLGVRAPELARAPLVERAVPDYSAVMANAAARRAPPHLTLVSGALCANRRTVAGRAEFADLPAEVLEHRGCSFCKCANLPPLTDLRGDPFPLLERQLARIRETAGRAGRARGRYEFFDIRAFQRFDETFALVLRLGLPPSVFLFNPRVDDVLNARARIERVLPALAAAGHEVRILSMGVENFSPAENARFNKDVSPAQVDELLALVRRWEEAHGPVFKPFKAGGDAVELGFILFTPWTTLADLRVNLEAAAARGFPPRGYWLYSVLLIEPVSPGEKPTPILRLARRDGLLAEAFPDRAQVYGLRKNEGDMDGVLPWRFRDARVARLFGLLTRACALDRDGAESAHFAGDAAFARVREVLRPRPPAPLDLAFGLLAALEAGAPASDAELLRGAADRAAAARPAPLRPAPVRAPQPVTAEGRAAAGVIARLRAAPPALFAGVEYGPVEELPGRVRLTLREGSRALVVDLLDARSAGPAFLRSRRFRALYHDDAPPPTARERERLAALLGLLDGALDAGSADSSAEPNKAR